MLVSHGAGGGRILKPLSRVRSPLHLPIEKRTKRVRPIEHRLLLLPILRGSLRNLLWLRSWLCLLQLADLNVILALDVLCGLRLRGLWRQA